MWGSEQTTLLRRELERITEERTIVLALLVQLVIAAFASFLVVGLVSLTDPGALDGPAVEVAITGDAADAVVDGVEGDVRAIAYDNPEAAATAFERGTVDALIEATRTEDGRLELTASIPDAELQSTVVAVQLQEAFESLEQHERAAVSDRLNAEPLSVPPARSETPFVSFTYTVLLPVLMLLPVFITGSITVDTIREEFDRNTFEVLRLAPVSVVEIVDAKVAATTSLAPAQASLWLALLWLNGVSIAHPVWLVAFVGAVATATAIGSLWIALWVPDRRQGQLVYSVGILAVLAGATALPEHPANTIAKLGLGTPTVWSWLLVFGGVVVAVGVLVGSRRQLRRQTRD